LVFENRHQKASEPRERIRVEVWGSWLPKVVTPRRAKDGGDFGGVRRGLRELAGGIISEIRPDRLTGE
jgi:hypothetical protein